MIQGVVLSEVLRRSIGDGEVSVRPCDPNRFSVAGRHSSLTVKV